MLLRDACRLGSVVALFSMAAWAAPIRDPAMGIATDSLSDPITTGTMFGPNGNGGGAFGFFNSTGLFIRGLVFGTFILPGLTTQELTGVFSCNGQNTPGHPNPFFQNCFINYTQSTGQLKIAFFGALPQEVPADPNDAEIGEHEGVPPLLPGCRATPDVARCRSVGHFLVTLNDNFATSPNGVGGWSTSATPGIFLPGGPIFTVLEIDTAPEPATVGMVLASIVGFAAFAARHRKRLKHC